jgi:hypothetical protein
MTAWPPRPPRRRWEGQAVREAFTGFDYHRRHKAVRQVCRVVDRESDRYTERIVDATGNVVREIDEPLSQHRGHGAAKRRRSQPEPGAGGL